jgi:hypothetical protein
MNSSEDSLNPLDDPPTKSNLTSRSNIFLEDPVGSKTSEKGECDVDSQCADKKDSGLIYFCDSVRDRNGIAELSKCYPLANCRSSSDCKYIRNNACVEGICRPDQGSKHFGTLGSLELSLRIVCGIFTLLFILLWYTWSKKQKRVQQKTFVLNLPENDGVVPRAPEFHQLTVSSIIPCPSQPLHTQSSYSVLTMTTPLENVFTRQPSRESFYSPSLQNPAHLHHSVNQAELRANSGDYSTADSISGSTIVSSGFHSIEEPPQLAPTSIPPAAKPYVCGLKRSPSM